MLKQYLSISAGARWCFVALGSFFLSLRAVARRGVDIDFWGKFLVKLSYVYAGWVLAFSMLTQVGFSFRIYTQVKAVVCLIRRHEQAAKAFKPQTSTKFSHVHAGEACGVLDKKA
jgi:hypothetical protein